MALPTSDTTVTYPAGATEGTATVLHTEPQEDGRIAGIFRHDDLAASLTLNGLDADDAVAAPRA